MIIHINTDGWELLRPAGEVDAEQRCSEVAWYSEYKEALYKVFKATLDSSRPLT